MHLFCIMSEIVLILNVLRVSFCRLCFCWLLFIEYSIFLWLWVCVWVLIANSGLLECYLWELFVGWIGFIFQGELGRSAGCRVKRALSTQGLSELHFLLKWFCCKIIQLAWIWVTIFHKSAWGCEFSEDALHSQCQGHAGRISLLPPPAVQDYFLLPWHDDPAALLGSQCPCSGLLLAFLSPEVFSFPALRFIQLSEERVKVTSVDSYPQCEISLWHWLSLQGSPIILFFVLCSFLIFSPAQ